MMTCAQDNRDILDALLDHLDVAGMAEAFVRIVAADEQSLPNVPADSLAWLADTDLLPKLLTRCLASFLGLQLCKQASPGTQVPTRSLQEWDCS